jgi:alpha-L-fucosidase 2
MLLQSQRGTIVVFPATPESWRDVSFRTLRAEGGFLVSAAKAGGTVRQVEITAERGGRCMFLSPWTGERMRFEMRRGEVRILEPPNP